MKTTRKYQTPTVDKNSLYVAPMEEFMPLIKETLSEGRTVNFYPRGISMLPMLRQGVDSVVLAPVTAKLKKYDIPLYVRENGHYILHRIVKVGKEEYVCIGDNQFEKEYGVGADSVIGVVSEFVRNGKKHSVNELGYKTYCRIWHYSRPIRHAYRRLRCFAGRVLRYIKAKLKNKRR